MAHDKCISTADGCFYVLSHNMESNQPNQNSHEVLKSSIENVNVEHILWVDTILLETSGNRAITKLQYENIQTQNFSRRTTFT